MDKDIHWYSSPYGNLPGASSISKLKDPVQPLMIWAVNQSLEHIRLHSDKINKVTANEILAEARRKPKEEFEDAGDIGTWLHQATEIYDKTGKKPEMVSEVQKVLFCGYKSFLDDFNPIVKAVETKVWWHSTEDDTVKLPIDVGFGGTIDRILETKLNISFGEDRPVLGTAYLPILIDLKTSSGIWSSHIMQSVAYYKAYLQRNKDSYLHGVGVLRLEKNLDNIIKLGEDKYIRVVRKKTKNGELSELPQKTLYDFKFIENEQLINAYWLEFQGLLLSWWAEKRRENE